MMAGNQGHRIDWISTFPFSPEEFGEGVQDGFERAETQWWGTMFDWQRGDDHARSKHRRWSRHRSTHRSDERRATLFGGGWKQPSRTSTIQR